MLLAINSPASITDTTEKLYVVPGRRSVILKNVVLSGVDTFTTMAAARCCAMIS